MDTATATAALNLMARFERLDSPAIADAQRGMHVMHPRIRSYVPGAVIAGPAFTVKAYAGSMLSVEKAILEAQAGDVIVVNADADLVAGGIWGDIMAAEAKLRAFKAIIIDGAVRDQRGLREVGFPTFAAGSTPRLGTNLQVGHTQVSISCGGVAVSPGDWIFADDDGVVSIPAHMVETILEAAEAIEHRDRDVARRVANGEHLADLMDLHRLIYEPQTTISVMSNFDASSQPPAISSQLRAGH